MKIFKKLIMSLALTILAVSTASAEKIPYVNPAGDRFPIVAWYAFSNENQITAKRFQDLDAAGFTHIHSSLMGNEDCYRQVISAMSGTGIKVILSGLKSGGRFYNEWKQEPRISMWCIGDEPAYGMLDHCKQDKENIEKYDTSKLVYLNLCPSYSGSMKLEGTFKNYITTAIEKMDLSFLSYDHYPFLQHYTEKDGWVSLTRPTFYNDLEDAREVCSKKHIPFWTFCMSSGHHANSDVYEWRYLNPTAAELAIEAYAALAYGAQGLQYFRIAAIDGGEIYPDPPVDASGNTNSVWGFIKAINLRIQKLAPIFLGNEVIGVWHTGPLPQGTESLKTAPAPFTKIESGSSGLVVSQFVNNGRNYLMLLNKDVEKGQTIKVLRSSQVKRVNDNGVIVRDNHSTFTLSPADFILFTW